MTQALSVAETIVGRECRLEDLARRLARELGIDIVPDEESHGISARIWLSGENKDYRMFYTKGTIYSDGKGGVEYDDEEGEDIHIKRVGAEYPRIVIMNNAGRYSFAVNVPDYMLDSFLKGKRFDPSRMPMNLFYIRLRGAIHGQAIKPEQKVVYSGDPDLVVYPLRVEPIQQDIDEYITGDIIRYCLS